MRADRQLAYTCAEQWRRDEEHGGLRKAYQFRVEDVGGAEPRPLYIADDVCSRESRARELEQLFRRNDVALCHVRDVLEDWVEGCACP